MQIKIINPNTTASMSVKIGATARKVAGDSTTIVVTSPDMGPVSIEGAYDEAMAVPGLLEEVRKGEAEGMDGYIIACFGDPGLRAAREIAKGPVVGIAEAAMHAASFVAAGFSIVTTLRRTIGISEHLVELYGMQRNCRRIRAVEVPVLELDLPGSDARARILQECRLALENDGSDAIILGCAGMSDLCDDLSRTLQVPVIDGVAAAVKMVEALLGLGLATSKHGDFAMPLPKPYTGRLADFSMQ